MILYARLLEADYMKMRIAAGVLFVLAMSNVATAGDVDLAPPEMRFSQGGEAYHWGVAHGVTGSVALSREIGGGRSAPELVISCSGVHSGGFQARFYEPQGGAAQLRLTAGKSVFRVYRGVQDLGDHPFVEGHGDLPDGFFDALSDTPTVSIAYGARTTTFPGPGAALTRHFQRYCQSLAQRGTRDEL
jgi:hypothetical protein